MKVNKNIITADEGKVLRRKESGEIFGNEIALGFSYYIGGVKLAEPHADTAEDFEEIDEPKEEETAPEAVEETPAEETETPVEETDNEEEVENV